MFIYTEECLTFGWECLTFGWEREMDWEREVEECLTFEIQRQGGQCNLNSLLSVQPQIRRQLRDVRLIDFVRERPHIFELSQHKNTAWLLRLAIEAPTCDAFTTRGVSAMLEHKRMQALQYGRDVRTFVRRFLYVTNCSCIK